MGLQEAEFYGDLWFFAYNQSAKVAQNLADPEVNVSFSGPKNSAWTSVAGRAEVVHDRAKAEALYSPTLKAWFPDGLDAPTMLLDQLDDDRFVSKIAAVSTPGLRVKPLQTIQRELLKR